MPAPAPAPAGLAPFTGLFVAEPGIAAAIEYRGGGLWITAPGGERLAIHAPSPLDPAGTKPDAFVLRAGRGVGERAVFDGARESFTLGGWLYRRVAT